MKPDIKPEDRLRIARQFISVLPQAQDIGMSLEDVGPGWVALAVEYDPRLAADAATGETHNGVIATLLDTAGGAAVITHPDSGLSTATLDLRIDYLRPAARGARLHARAECHILGRSTAHVRAVAFTGAIDQPVAIANGVFTIEREWRE